MRGIALVIILTAFTFEIVHSSSSFVRAYECEQVALFNDLSLDTEKSPPNLSEKPDLKTRRFAFGMDAAIANHGSSAAVSFTIDLPGSGTPSGFHFVDRSPQDFIKVIFQPPKARLDLLLAQPKNILFYLTKEFGDGGRHLQKRSG